MAEINTLYRLLILYILHTADRALSNTEITVFMLEQDYARYFSIQQALNELVTQDSVTAENADNNTWYRITDDGIYILQAYQEEIAESFRMRIDEEFQKEGKGQEDDIRAVSSVYPNKQGSYNVSCQIREKEKSKLDLMLNVASGEQAERISRNWKERYLDAYSTLIELLSE